MAVAHGEQCPLDRFVHEATGPHLAGPELLEDVEAAHERIHAGLPAAPGAVVLVVVAAAALLEGVVARAGPGKFVDEVGHVPSLSGRPSSRIAPGRIDRRPGRP